MNVFLLNRGEGLWLKVILFTNSSRVVSFETKLFFSLIFYCFECISLEATAPSVCKQENTDLLNTPIRFCLETKAFDVYAGFIYWTAKEAGADTWAEVIHTDSSTSSNDILGVSFDWDPGFRVGIGYQCDQWDVGAIYTRFHTKGKDSISSSPGSVHSAFLGNFYIDNPLGLGLSGPPYEKASIDWTIHYNMFDWDLGFNCCICKSLQLRPFMGIKGGWIDQSIHTKWENPELLGITFSATAKEDLENNFWGLGPAFGIDTKWMVFCNQIYLFGDFSAAIMWGHWTFSDVYKNDFSQKVIIDLDNHNGGASTVRSFMGFGWDACFCKDQYRFSTKLGYEMQFWLDQLQFYSFTGGRLVN